MTPDELRQLVFRVLRTVAPESHPEQLEPGRNFRDELDLDSVDFMNVVVGLHQALDVDIPEADYAKMSSVDGCVAYLAARLAARS